MEDTRVLSASDVVDRGQSRRKAVAKEKCHQSEGVIEPREMINNNGQNEGGGGRRNGSGDGEGNKSRPEFVEMRRSLNRDHSLAG